MTERVLIDSMVALYAMGGEFAWREECRRALRLVSDGVVEGFCSVEAVQEVAHHRLRVSGDPGRAAAQARAFSQTMAVLGFDARVLDTALGLIAAGEARGRDAVHAATALVHGLDQIVSYDTAFDAVPGLSRLTPAQLSPKAPVDD
jgi:predicted nucleic acid-binding protein